MVISKSLEPISTIVLPIITFSIVRIESKVPESYKINRLFSFCTKKVMLNVVENYRDLPFIDYVCKIFRGLLYNIFAKWANERRIISELRADFRRRYTTTDNIFNLSGMVHDQL